MHDLDVLCLSELGEQGQGLGSKLPNNDRAIPPAVDAWLLELLSDSAAPPVSVYSDGHYATLVKTRRVSVEKYEFVRGFVRGHEDRGFQHLCVCAFMEMTHQCPSSTATRHLRTSKK